MLNGLSTVAPAAAVNAGGAGAFMLNVLEVVGVSVDVPDIPVNWIVAPVTAPKLDAVIVLKLIGLEPVIVLLPAVQVAPPTPATALPVIVAEPEAALPKRSVMLITI